MNINSRVKKRMGKYTSKNTCSDCAKDMILDQLSLGYSLAQTGGPTNLDMKKINPYYVKEKPLYRAGQYTFDSDVAILSKSKNGYLSATDIKTGKKFGAFRNEDGSYRVATEIEDAEHNVKDFYRQSLSSQSYGDRFLSAKSESWNEFEKGKEMFDANLKHKDVESFKKLNSQITSALGIASKRNLNVGVKENEYVGSHYFPKDHLIELNLEEIQKVDSDIEDMLSHELSHAKHMNPYLNAVPPLKQLYQYQNKLVTDDDVKDFFNLSNVKNKHDRDLEESAADLDALRYHLKKNGILNDPYQFIDTRDTKLINSIMDAINNNPSIKDRYMVKRVKRLFNENKLIDALNYFSDLKSVNSNDNVAQTGQIVPDKEKESGLRVFNGSINDLLYEDNELSLMENDYKERFDKCKTGYCLERANRYYNTYVAPKYGLASTWEQNKSMGLSSGKGNPNEKLYGEDVSSWDYAGIVSERGGKLVYAAKPVKKGSEGRMVERGDSPYEFGNMTMDERKAKIKAMNLPVGTVINFGYGGDPKKREDISYNEQKGLVASRHSARVVGFDEEGNPMMYDYTGVYPVHAQNFPPLQFPITNIVIPKGNESYTFEHFNNNKNIRDGYSPTKVKYSGSESIDSDELDPFIESLAKYKKEFSNKLGLTYKEYDELQRQAVALAIEETEGGNNFVMRNKVLPSYIIDKAASKNTALGSLLNIMGAGKTQGITQINKKVFDNPRTVRQSEIDALQKQEEGMSVADAIEHARKTNPGIREKLQKFGKDKIDPYNPDDIALATLLLLQDNKYISNKNAKKEGNKQDLSGIEKATYQWNSPSLLYKGLAQGQLPAVQKASKAYNETSVEYSPNMQTLGNILFDSNQARPYLNGYIVKDKKTGKDFGVVRNEETGKYDFKNFQTGGMYSQFKRYVQSGEKVYETKYSLPATTVKGTKNSIQKLGNIKFDTDYARKNKDGSLIVTDIYTGKDYGVVRNLDGDYRFKGESIKDFKEKFVSRVEDENKKSLMGSLFGAPLDLVMGLPQAATTYMISDGEETLPSKALGIENKWGALATDIILDPANIPVEKGLNVLGSIDDLLDVSTKVRRAGNEVGKIPVYNSKKNVRVLPDKVVLRNIKERAIIQDPETYKEYASLSYHPSGDHSHIDMIQVDPALWGNRTQDVLYDMAAKSSMETDNIPLRSGEILLSPAKTKKAHERLVTKVVEKKNHQGIDHDVVDIFNHKNPNVQQEWLDAYENINKFKINRETLTVNDLVKIASDKSNKISQKVNKLIREKFKIRGNVDDTLPPPPEEINISGYRNMYSNPNNNIINNRINAFDSWTPKYGQYITRGKPNANELNDIRDIMLKYGIGVSNGTNTQKSPLQTGGNIQQLGNIKFDSNKSRKNKDGSYVVTDINTGKDFGVVRDYVTGKYDFVYTPNYNKESGTQLKSSPKKEYGLIDVPQTKAMQFFTGTEQLPSEYLDAKLGRPNGETAGAWRNALADVVLDPLNALPVAKIKKGLKWVTKYNKSGLPVVRQTVVPDRYNAIKKGYNNISDYIRGAALIDDGATVIDPVEALVPKAQTGYMTSPYEYRQEVIGSLARFPYEEFNISKWDNKNSFGKNIGGFVKDNNNIWNAGMLGLGVLGAVSNNVDNKRYYDDNRRRMKSNYVEIPYDQNSYNSAVDNFYNYSQTGQAVEEQSTDLWYHPTYKAPVKENADPKDNWDNLVNEFLSPTILNNNQEDDYHKIFSGFNDNNNGDLLISPILDDISSMGIKPSSINTGKHKEGSDHYKGKAFDLGLNTSFGGSTEKMLHFRDYVYPQLKKKHPSLKLLDETVQGSEHSTGPHLHLYIK